MTRHSSAPGVTSVARQSAKSLPALAGSDKPVILAQRRIPLITVFLFFGTRRIRVVEAPHREVHPTMQLTDKVVIITGAARRLGRAIALDLAEHGCQIVAHYGRSAAEAANLADTIRGMGRRCLLVHGDLIDATLPARIVAQAVAAFGRIDALVNNAAVFPRTPIDELTADTFVDILKVNLIAPVLMAQAVWPHFQRAGAGRIVNITDISAERPWPGYIAYCAAKAGLANATRSLARAMAPVVQVNAVAPGAAEFPEGTDEAHRDRVLAHVPLGRAGSPKDIAAAVRFLIARGDYITGETINVDGGRTAAW